MEPFQRFDHFVESTRTALFVREADQVLMIRPDKTMGINESAAAILSALYNREGRGSKEALSRLADSLRVDEGRIVEDARSLLDTVGALLNEDFSPRKGLRFECFDRSRIQFPTLAEIALTYGCQNRCVFCYASSPYRAAHRPAMSTEDVKAIMDKIFHEAHVPSLSFTGGEATLRPDLPELIRYGSDLGFRINLISNGLRLGNSHYAKILVDAGLDSAQISLEAADAKLHDEIVGRPGAHRLTVGAVENLKALGIHVHTNSTLCRSNLHAAEDLMRFVAQDLKLRTLSMNMLIPTGEALHGEPLGVSYREVGEKLPRLIEVSNEMGIKFVWYSPIPYCIFNPVLHGLGAKSCACVDGILSVDPCGEMLPCSSFENGVGSLRERSFAELYEGNGANYWKKKEFVPPSCRNCPDLDICGGACPLYWDAAGSFDELPGPLARDAKLRRQWEESRAKSGCLGVEPASNKEKSGGYAA